MTSLRAHVLSGFSGLCMGAAFPLLVPWISRSQLDPAGHLEFIAWVGLLPLLYCLERASTWRLAFSYGLTAGIVFFLITVHWLFKAAIVFGIDSPAVGMGFLGVMVTYLACYWGLAAALEHAVRHHLGTRLWMVLPCAWVIAELLRTHLLTGFPWANLGYSQARHPIIAQLAALFGVHGVAGFVAFVNCVAHEVLHSGLRRSCRPVVATLGLLLLACVYGAIRIRDLQLQIRDAETIRVALIQPNLNRHGSGGRRESTKGVLARLVPATRTADESGADLVVWPEGAYPTVLPDDFESLDGAPHLSPLQRSHVLMGLSTVAPSVQVLERVGVRNSVFLLAPDLSVVGRSEKQHLVPFGEYLPLRRWIPSRLISEWGSPDMESGSAVQTVSFTIEKSGSPHRVIRIAPLVCYDAIFPRTASLLALGQPDLFVNVANESWAGTSSEPAQFLSISRMRAIETGRPLLRASYTGHSAIVLPTGELVDEPLPLGVREAPEPAVLNAAAPLLSASTPYLALGDLSGLIASTMPLIAVVATRGLRRYEQSTLRAENSFDA